MGYTQAALGSVNAISAGFGGLIQGWFGCEVALIALGVSGVLALVMAVYINTTTEENPRAKHTAKFAGVVRARVLVFGKTARERGLELLRRQHKES